VAIIDVRTQTGTGAIWDNRTTPADLLETLAKYSASGCIVSSTLANTCDFQTGNAQLKREIEGQQRLLGCAVVNTAHVEESCRDMHQYLAAKNFAGVIVSSGVAGKHVTLDECSEILNAFRRFNKIVFLEARNREAVAAVKEVALAFPTIRFVMLSMGGDDWPNAAAAASKATNLYLETSGNLNPNKIKYAYDMVGPNRLVYGSNWPYSDPALTIGLVEDSDISDEDKKRVFELNALRLLGYDRGQQ